MNTEVTRPVWEPSRFGESYTLTLRRGYLDLVVVREIQSRGDPSPTPYAVTVFGNRLNRRYATAEEAKTVAVVVAGRVLAEATDNLTAFSEDA